MALCFAKGKFQFHFSDEARVFEGVDDFFDLNDACWKLDGFSVDTACALPCKLSHGRWMKIGDEHDGVVARNATDFACEYRDVRYVTDQQRCEGYVHGRRVQRKVAYISLNEPHGWPSLPIRDGKHFGREIDADDGSSAALFEQWERTSGAAT